jgi:membrane fusion protein, adhesin transport system
MSMPQNTSFSSHPDLDRGPRRAVLILLGSLAGFLILALVWMSFAKLDISVHAIGKVVPSSRVQTIQSLEGGIVRSLAVREGQSVKRGDLLGVVENLQYNAELGEGQQNQNAYQSAIARLDAELGSRPPVFDARLRQQAPGLVAEQRQLWASRQRELRTALDVVHQQIAQRQEELSEARSRVQALTQVLGPARETMAIEEKLLAQGAGARADFLRARQEVSRLEGELESARINVPRVQAALEEGRSHLVELQARHQAEGSRERSDLEGKTVALNEQMAAREDRVKRRELRSPMDGIVNRLNIHTEGAVAKAGETIMELVPIQDTLLIAARVKPADIAFIRPGQAAQVRVTAYDSSIFGSLQGKVVRVGADAVADEKDQKNEPYFEVYVETQRNYLGKPEERLTISPGMTADASIQTGKRTLMEYLLKPVVKTFDKSLRER